MAEPTQSDINENLHIYSHSKLKWTMAYPLLMNRIITKVYWNQHFSKNVKNFVLEHLKNTNFSWTAQTSQSDKTGGNIKERQLNTITG